MHNTVLCAKFAHKMHFTYEARDLLQLKHLGFWMFQKACRDGRFAFISES